ncbi:MAG: hypothetical protein HRU75_15110 [Planctomycetia bacterium]|nr:MAG: hypothetical protein HRU75_15110 [Planctomycetia bacterium]
MNEAQCRVHEGFARLRAALRRCRACGYDRREHRTGRCPECGLEGDLFGERREALAWLVASSRGFAHRPIPRLAARWLGGRKAWYLTCRRCAWAGIWLLAAAAFTVILSVLRVEAGVSLGWGAEAARGGVLSGEYQRVQVSLGSGRVTSGGPLSHRPWSGDVLFESAQIVGIGVDVADYWRVTGVAWRLGFLVMGITGVVLLGSLGALAGASFGAGQGVTNVIGVVIAPWLTLCAFVTVAGDLLVVLVVVGALTWGDSALGQGAATFLFAELLCLVCAAMGGLQALCFASGSMQRAKPPADAD